MPEQHVTPERVMQYSWAFALSLAVETAVHHGIFDSLDQGAKTIDEIRTATGASQRGLRALLNLLLSMGLVSRDSEAKYALAPDAAAFLVRGKPGYFGGLTRHISKQLLPPWLQLNETVGTGKPATAVNQQATGAQFFQEFVVDILPLSFAASQALAEDHAKHAGSGATRVLDLAAGSAVWSIPLAQKLPQATVTVVDWEGVLPAAKKTSAQFGVGDRYSYIAGDLADADFGTGHTIAVLGNILHSEGETRSRALLRKTFAALAPGGTIAIAEFLANEDHSGPMFATIFAVNMLLMTDDGDTFSAQEIFAWLREAGFENPRLLEVPGPAPLVLANRPA